MNLKQMSKHLDTLATEIGILDRRLQRLENEPDHSNYERLVQEHDALETEWRAEMSQRLDDARDERETQVAALDVGVQ